MKKDTYIVFGEWEDDLEDLDDHEVAALTRAFFKYVRRGEKSTFEDRMVRACWRKVQGAEDRANDAYDKKCEQNRLNGQKGGAPKGNKNAQKQPNNRTVEKTTETTLPDPDPYPYPDPNRGRGRDPEELSAPMDTTTTAPDFDEILMTWNNQDITRPIIKIGDSGKRHDRTEMAVAVAGGHGAFLNAIRSLKDQAYFQNRQKDGYKVEYDWFVDPENFQNVLEGKYAKSRDKFGDGWEVVEFG